MSAEITRRFMLGGLGSLLSTAVLAKPETLHGGHSNPLLPSPGLSVRLDFADGKSLVFVQSQATDIGDYVGPFVHQKCFRHIASGNGDYRDAFLVDFRPDADGKRDEVVIELGTLVKFVNGKSPATANGVVPVHLFVPPRVAISKVPGNTSAQAGTVETLLTYITPSGESVAGGSPAIMLAAGDRIVLKSPPPAGGATHYNVYMKLIGVTPRNLFVLQNAAPIPIGQDWTAPATGLLMAGKAYNGATTPTAVAYTATISGGGLAAPVTIPVNMHWWGARWRWQSAPRPIVRRSADVYRMRAVPPFSSDLKYGAPAPNVRPWRGPMDNGGLTIAMKVGGDHIDIGFVTEYAAKWLIDGDAGSEASMRANGEATGTMSMWCRDADTGALVDTSVRKNAAYADADHARSLGLIPDVTNVVVSENRFGMDAAHFPGAAYPAALATDDPYFWEGAEAIANYGILQSNLGRASMGLPSLTSVTQPRAMAWGWRNIFQVAGFMPDATPSWFLGRSHWMDKVVPDQLAFGMRYVTATASPATTVFKLIPTTGSVPAFMLDYICVVVGWIKWTGKFPQFDPVVEYAATPRVVMSYPDITKYGWDCRNPEPYYTPVIDARKRASAVGGPSAYYDVKFSRDTPISWRELQDCYLPWAAVHPSQGASGDPATWPADDLVYGWTYAPTFRAALAMLSLAGIEDARAGHDTLKRWLDRKPGRLGGSALKWAISPE